MKTSELDLVRLEASGLESPRDALVLRRDALEEGVLLTVLLAGRGALHAEDDWILLDSDWETTPQDAPDFLELWHRFQVTEQEVAAVRSHLSSSGEKRLEKAWLALAELDAPTLIASFSQDLLVFRASEERVGEQLAARAEQLFLASLQEEERLLKLSAPETSFENAGDEVVEAPPERADAEVEAAVRDFLERSSDADPEDPNYEEIARYMACDMGVDEALELRERLATSPAAARRYLEVQADLERPPEPCPPESRPDWLQELISPSLFLQITQAPVSLHGSEGGEVAALQGRFGEQVLCPRNHPGVLVYVSIVGIRKLHFVFEGARADLFEGALIRLLEPERIEAKIEGAEALLELGAPLSLERLEGCRACLATPSQVIPLDRADSR